MTTGHNVCMSRADILAAMEQRHPESRDIIASLKEKWSLGRRPKGNHERIMEAIAGQLLSGRKVTRKSLLKQILPYGRARELDAALKELSQIGALALYRTARKRQLPITAERISPAEWLAAQRRARIRDDAKEPA